MEQVITYLVNKCNHSFKKKKILHLPSRNHGVLLVLYFTFSSVLIEQHQT